MDDKEEILNKTSWFFFFLFLEVTTPSFLVFL